MANREDENHDEFIDEKNIIKPEIGIEIDGISFNYKFFETLESLSKTYSFAVIFAALLATTMR